LFWKVLPYKVPIATQSAIVLPYDMEANGLPRFGHLSADNMFGVGYEAVKPEDVPNFLDESWAIKEEESTDGEE